MLRGLCCRKMSVCLSDTLRHCVETDNILKRFHRLHRRVAVFPYEILWQYPDPTGTPLTVASNAMAVKNDNF